MFYIALIIKHKVPEVDLIKRSNKDVLFMCGTNPDNLKTPCVACTAICSFMTKQKTPFIIGIRTH